MIWIVVSSILVAVAFLGTFLATANTWDATIAGGLVSLLFVLGFIYRITRPPVTPNQRRWIIGMSLIVIVGTALYWNIMYSMTHYQYDMLHTIRKVIHHGIAAAMFTDEGKKTFVRYIEQRERGIQSVGKAFRLVAQFDKQDSTRLNTDAWEHMRMYVATISDTEVVLVVQDSLNVEGENASFKNFDSRVGMVQDRLRITQTGFVHETQN